MQCLGRKKKTHHIFSRQLKADQMPGPPREGQLILTFFYAHLKTRATSRISSWRMKRIMASP